MSMADVPTAEAPSVSVVVPTYNRAAMLARLLDSLASIDRPAGGFEVIVIDDGSTDDTAAVAAQADVRYLRQANAGPAAARNRGWQHARGDVVVFTDDDCVPTKRWLVELTAELDEHPELAAVGGAIRPLVVDWRSSYVQVEHLVDHGSDDRRGVRFLVTANAAVRRTALEAVGGFDESFHTPAGEDTDLSFRLRAAGWSLGVTRDAAVLHDHRTNWRGIFRTYRKHGRARRTLAQRHTEATSGAGAGEILHVSHWRNRYRTYRRSSGPVQAGSFVLLRVVGLACFSWGYFVDGRHDMATAAAAT